MVDILNRTPSDKKHQEFHDGEYEYWPISGGPGSKRLSFPAALISGLGLLAAVVSTALLAVALTVLYVGTAPVEIHSDRAILNVNIYNNYDGHPVSFIVSSTSHPDIAVFAGGLSSEKDTITVMNLEGDESYRIRYYVLEENEKRQIGEFYFTTLDPTEEAAGVPQETDAQTQPVESTNPDVTETASEETATETTVASTESVTEPTGESLEPKPPVWYPPAQKETEPSTEATEETAAEETAEASTEATTEATTEPEIPPVEPEVIGADFMGISFISSESGDLVPGYYSWTEIHSFRNIPVGTYEIVITQNGTQITEFTEDVFEGELSVSFDSLAIPIGVPAASSVKVTWADGTTATSTYSLTSPQMESVGLNAVKNPDGSHTFTVTVAADPGSGWALACESLLYCSVDAAPVVVELVPQSEDTYVGTYTTMIETDREVEEAVVFVKAIWSAAGNPSDVTDPQSMSNFFEYEP